MNSIPHIGAEAVRTALPAAELVDEITRAFADFSAFDVPERHHHGFEGPDGSTATMLLMPAWRRGSRAGVKIASIFPSNPDRGLPAVTSLYVLQSAETGRILATIDGAELTRLRTAATSAAAAARLARPDSGVLLMVGAGSLAEPLIRAHRAVRAIHTVYLWNRSRVRAERLAEGLAGRLARYPARTRDLSVTIVDEPDAAVGLADVVSCATMSKTPLIRSSAVRPGTHVDLVGAYRPDMREADSALVARASVFVDTRPGALAEAGDLLIPAREGVFDPTSIRADLHELCAGAHPGRTSDDEITLFKSVGHALEDLVAASLVYDRCPGTGQGE